ncbi:MAG: hypothetical protein A2Y13_05410 [Planctomycetes bacterium GWC2_45_44]|nr:MAG: hypothetical protein A2Y13_05410 [Planctomycetes bacterium GWC2_45_44]
MIIDMHAHVYAWPKIRSYRGSPSVPLSAEQQIEIMDLKGIDKAVILPLCAPEVPWEPQSSGEILHICEKYPGRFIPFCNMDPRMKANVGETVVSEFVFHLEQYKELGFKGVGEFASRIYWDDPRMLVFCEACQKVGFPILIHMTVPPVHDYGVLDDIGLPRMETVLKKFPELVILGHGATFWSHISGNCKLAGKTIYDGTLEGPVEPGGRIVELMRKYPNLWCDLSAGSGYESMTRDLSFTYEFLDEFQDRLVFGQDYCVITNDMQHLEWLRQLRDEEKITVDMFDKITGQNCIRLLKLHI